MSSRSKISKSKSSSRKSTKSPSQYEKYLKPQKTAQKAKTSKSPKRKSYRSQRLQRAPTEYLGRQEMEIDYEAEEIARRQAEARRKRQERIARKRALEEEKRQYEHRQIEEIERTKREEEVSKIKLNKPMKTEEEISTIEDEIIKEPELPLEYKKYMREPGKISTKIRKAEAELRKASKKLELDKLKEEELVNSARGDWYFQRGYDPQDVEKINREIEKIRQADIADAREDYQNDDINLEELQARENAEYRYLYPDIVTECKCVSDTILNLNGPSATNKNTYRLIEIEDWNSEATPNNLVIYLKHQNLVNFDKVCHYWNKDEKKYVPCQK